MPLVLTYDPDPAEVDDLVTLTLTGGAGDPAFARFELIVKPETSDLELGMLVDGDGDYVQTFTPDVPGEYGFRLYDVRGYVGLGQFAGDVGGGARQVILDTEDERQVVFAISPMDLRIQTIPGHDITLRLGISNSLVVSAEFVDPATDLARLAGIHVTSHAVMDDLLPVAPLNVNAIVTTLKARVKLLRANFEAHRVKISGSTHASADTTNVVNSDPCESDEAALLVLNEIYDDLLGHLMAGASGGTWHTNDDTLNLPITPKPTSKMQGHVTCTDLEERVYEEHRATTSISGSAVHDSADTSNTLADPVELPAVIKEYLKFIAANTSASIEGENDGAVLAERLIGMTPAP